MARRHQETRITLGEKPLDKGIAKHQMLRAQTFCQAVVRYFDTPGSVCHRWTADEHARVVFLHGPAAERHHRGELLHFPHLATGSTPAAGFAVSPERHSGTKSRPSC